MGVDNPNTIYFVGYARLPEKTPVKKQYDRIAVGIEVDMITEKIIDASVTVPTDLGQNIICSCIVGKNICEEEDIIGNIKKRFQAEAQGAIIMAFKNALEKYSAYRLINKI